MAHDRRPLLGQWIGLLGYHVVAASIAALTVALAAAVVPPAVYGDYGVMLSIVQCAGSIGLVWINQGVVRVGREERQQTGGTAGTVRAGFVLSALIGLVLGVCAAVVFTMWPAWAMGGVAVAIMAGTFCSLAAFQFLTSVSLSHGRFEGFAGGQVISRLGLLGGVLAFVVQDGLGPLVLLAGAGVGWLAAALYTGRPLTHASCRSADGWQARAREIVRYGRWLPLASAAGLLSQWMGLWLVHRQLGSSEAGIMLWATSVLALAAGTLQPLGAALSPRLIDLRLSDDRSRLRAQLALFVAIGLLLACLSPCVTASVLIAGMLLLPAAYAAAEGPVAVLFAAVPALTLSAVVIPLASAFERFIGALVAVIIAGAVVQLCLLPVLMPLYGVEGACFALATSTALMAVANCALAKATHSGREQLLPQIVRTAAVGIVPIVFAVAIRASEPRHALIIGLAASIGLLWLSRRAGLLRPLGALAPQFAFLPPGPQRLVLRVIAWLAN